MAYFDHAATTPMLPEAVEAMTSHLTVTGNASALHAAGRRARRTVEESREALAAALGARPSEIVFTGGGTESDNLAVKGLFWARRAADPRRVRVLASPVEHHAVLDAVHWLAEHEGAAVEWLPVDAYGRVQPDTLRTALAGGAEDVALVTVMWANNEVGTILPVAGLAAVCAEFGVPMHSDAVQAFGQTDVDFAASGLDAMTVTGHKVGGPYGVGALVLRRDDTPVPLLHGGEQERSRSGTLDVPAIAAFATAGSLAAERRGEYTASVGALRDELVRGIRAAVPDVILNGDPSPEGRLAANAHFTFPGCEGDALLLLLDAQGIACSTGSACTAGVAQPSHVLLAMGQPATHARATLRFSLGHTTTADEVADVIRAIGPAVSRARTAGQT
ncbi:cysteine desulfurase family protein [Streptomyces sp. NBC_01477]|uniref:cysteine desulfurase family protein n=1 Tax=Streptomyces sp. NBC_01477 TaxID=2976015 RepID=UPI002E356EEA|nr:cysteine desulfurase family protein [Streptomyces sp. NBC_01477]